MNPLVEHYLHTVNLIESAVLDQVPPILRPRGLDTIAKRNIALALADGHALASQLQASAKGGRS